MYPRSISRLHVTPSTLALVVSIVFALAGGPAGAAKGKLSVLNCGPTKVKLCVFDKTDISLLSENRSVELGPGEWSTKVGCSTNGGCKVKVVKSGSGCINTSHETSIADAKTLDEVAYRFNGSSFDKVSDDRAYFDSAANRVCPGTPANIQFAALNCTGGSLSLCVYKDGSLIRAAALSVGASSTFSCGKPDACTVTAGNCTATLQKTVTYTVSAGAYTVTRRQSLPGVLSFARASDDVNHFENVKVSCPATK